MPEKTGGYRSREKSRLMQRNLSPVYHIRVKNSQAWRWQWLPESRLPKGNNECSMRLTWLITLGIRPTGGTNQLFSPVDGKSATTSVPGHNHREQNLGISKELWRTKWSMVCEPKRSPGWRKWKELNIESSVSKTLYQQSALGYNDGEPTPLENE